eukprot:scaffold143_cov260-Pinguiococcus_pyrenoidosus.AAC.48
MLNTSLSRISADFRGYAQAQVQRTPRGLNRRHNHSTPILACFLFGARTCLRSLEGQTRFGAFAPASPPL